jgi:protocatechuate 3,4-dioxygenase, beta subunit
MISSEAAYEANLLKGKRFDSVWDRRRFLASVGAGGLFFVNRGAFAQALVLTPDQTIGPYYPDRMPLDLDNDLLIINDSITPGVGTVSWISGRVLDRNGNPVRSALVEIWLADNVGSYVHSQGALNGRRDSNFQGYGKFITASSGEYLFRAIKPGLYPGRVRHVHYKITVPGGATLVTQLYIEGETNTNDGVLNGIRDASQRASVIRPWTAIPNSPVGALAVTFDIVLNYTPSSVPTATRPTLVSMAGVTNAATLHEGAASGSWVTLFGDSLSTTTRTWAAGDFANNRLPESLDGVTVQINNQPAPVYYVSPKQLNVLAPQAASDGNVQVTVTNAAGTSAPVSVNLQRFMPGFFQFPQEYVAAVRADGTILAPAGLIAGVTSVAARPTETIMLFGTGFGPTLPATLPNQVITDPVPTANPVKIQIHNQQATVTYAGLTSAGLYQINVTVPELEDGDYPVTAEVGGVRTAKFARIRVQRQASVSAAKRPRKLDADQKAYLALIRKIRKGMAPVGS